LVQESQVIILVILEGSGVSMLSSCNFPYVTEESTASFPEASFGYAPDGSSIYHLSKMQGELGTMLALTGYQLKGSELVGAGLANYLLNDTEGLVGELTESQSNFNFNFSKNKYINQWQDDFKSHHKIKGNKNFIDDNLSPTEKYKLDINEYNKVYEYPWKADTINIDNAIYGESNSVLVNELLKQQGGKNPKEVFNIRNYKGVEYTNSLANYENVISVINTNTNDNLRLDGNMKEINRCFRFDTIKDIKQALAEEDTEFSRFCLERLNQKSPISLAVTLRLLRNARNLDYSEILQQELIVSKNILLKSKDFENYMENKTSRKTTTFEHRDLSKEEVDSYFEDVDMTNINLDLKQHSLLPNRDYIHKYPDCLKFLVNENSRANANIRELFDYESFHYLMTNLYNNFNFSGIDMRNTNLDIKDIRDVIGRREKEERVRNNEKDILGQYLQDQKIVEQYFKDKSDYIEKVKENKEAVEKIIEKKIEEKFERVTFLYKIRALKKLATRLLKVARIYIPSRKSECGSNSESGYF
jgi:enoyl-CoA hydratase/carnithine racemase